MSGCYCWLQVARRKSSTDPTEIEVQNKAHGNQNHTLECPGIVSECLCTCTSAVCPSVPQ